MLCYRKISVFCSFNLGGGGRAGAKYITTNANTNENTGASVNVNSRAGNSKGGTKIIYTNANTDKNTGAKVTINSRAPEVPSDIGGDGRSYTYVYISCKNVTDRKYMTSAMLPQNQCVLFFQFREGWQS